MRIKKERCDMLTAFLLFIGLTFEKLVHSAAHSACCGSHSSVSLRVFNISNKALSGEHHCSYGSSVLQRASSDLSRVNDTCACWAETCW